MDSQRTNQDEETLATLFRSGIDGNAGDYRQFLEIVSKIVRGIVNARAGGLSNEDREDIVQDVIFSIHNKRHTWRSDFPVKPWFYAIARYKIIDRFRALGRGKFVDIDDYADGLAQEETDSTQALDVETLVGRLKGKQAEVVRSIGLEGLSITDTAQKMGMKENAVRVNFHRGLEKLREFSRELDEEIDNADG